MPAPRPVMNHGFLNETVTHTASSVPYEFEPKIGKEVMEYWPGAFHPGHDIHVLHDVVGKSSTDIHDLLGTMDKRVIQGMPAEVSSAIDSGDISHIFRTNPGKSEAFTSLPQSVQDSLGGPQNTGSIYFRRKTGETARWKLPEIGTDDKGWNANKGNEIFSTATAYPDDTYKLTSLNAASKSVGKPNALHALDQSFDTELQPHGYNVSKANIERIRSRNPNLLGSEELSQVLPTPGTPPPAAAAAIKSAGSAASTEADMFDVAKKLIPNIEENMPDAVREAFEGGKVKSIFRTGGRDLLPGTDTRPAMSHGKAAMPSSHYFLLDDGRAARYGSDDLGHGWMGARASVPNVIKTQDDPFVFDNILFGESNEKGLSVGSDISKSLPSGVSSEPIVGKNIYETFSKDGKIVNSHGGNAVKDIYRRDGTATFFDDAVNPVRGAKPNLVNSKIEDLNFLEKENMKGNSVMVPELKSGSAAAPTPPPSVVTAEPASRLRGKGVGSPTPPADEPASRLRGTLAGEPPASGPSVATANATKVTPLADEYDTGTVAAKIAAGEPVTAPPPVSPSPKPVAAISQRRLEALEKMAEYGPEREAAIARAKLEQIKAGQSTTPPPPRGPTIGTPTNVTTGASAQGPRAGKPVQPTGAAVVDTTLMSDAEKATMSGVKGGDGISVVDPGLGAKIKSNPGLTAREAMGTIGKEIKTFTKAQGKVNRKIAGQELSSAVAAGFKQSKNLRLLGLGALVGVGYGASRAIHRENEDLQS